MGILPQSRVTSLIDTLETGALSLTILEDGTETPDPEKLEEIEQTVVSRFGWAFRYGMGASNSLNDYRYGFIVPGITMNPETLGDFEEKLKSETTLDNPTVLAKPRQNISDEEFSRMEQLGQLPHEALSALSGLKDEVEKQKD